MEMGMKAYSAAEVPSMLQVVRLDGRLYVVVSSLRSIADRQPDQNKEEDPKQTLGGISLRRLQICNCHVKKCGFSSKSWQGSGSYRNNMYGKLRVV